MDTTPKYILMCEKAEEVQKGASWSGYKKEFFTHLGLIWIDCNGEWWAKEGEVRFGYDWVWLPRQDQLQEMILGPVPVVKDYYDLNILFALYTERAMVHQRLQSYEQLWLTFVMRERYQRRWDEKKEEWILNATV